MSIARTLFAAVLWGPLAGSAVAQTASLPPGTAGPQDAPPAAAKPAAGDPLGTAEAKLAAGDSAAAIALLTPYAAEHPGDARALYDLGYAEDTSGNTAMAESSYKKAIADNPRQFEAQAALGLLLARQGKTQQAIAALSAAEKLTPDPPDAAAQAQANRALARLLLPANPDAAGAALVDALRESNETPADTLLAARIAEGAGNTDAAADAYGRVLAETPVGSPEQSQAASGLAHLLIAAKRYPEAEAVLQKALLARPGDAALEARLAEVQAAEGKQPEAIATLQALHQAHPENAAVTSMLADLNLQTGNTAAAVPLYATLVQQHPQDAALLASYGDALVRSNQSVQAVPVLEKAVEIDPANGNAASSLAFAASQAHQPETVLRALAIRSKVMSDTPATYFLAATAYDTLHQTKRAEVMYRQFLAVAGNGFPDEVWQARHRLVALER